MLRAWPRKSSGLTTPHPSLLQPAVVREVVTSSRSPVCCGVEVCAGIYIDPGQTVEEAGVTLPKIEDGVLTHGIFMEAFRWDDKTKMLADSHEGEMVSYCPLVHMLPVPNFVIPEEDYNSPMYKTNFRQGMLSTTGHSTNFVVPIHFPTDKPPSYWVNKGAALLCQNVL